MKIFAVLVYLLNWRSCEGIVFSSFTYMMAADNFNSQDEVVLAGCRAACAGLCMRHVQCCGFTWESTEVPGCILHIKIYTGMATRTTGQPYRGMTLTNHQLFRLPRLVTNDLWQIRADQCESFGAVLLPAPVSVKDLETVASHGKSMIDVKVSAETGDLINSAGLPVDPTYMQCAVPAGAVAEDQCFAVDFANCFYHPCSKGFVDYLVNICGY